MACDVQPGVDQVAGLRWERRADVAQTGGVAGAVGDVEAGLGVAGDGRAVRARRTRLGLVSGQRPPVVPAQSDGVRRTGRLRDQIVGRARLEGADQGRVRGNLGSRQPGRDRLRDRVGAGDHRCAPVGRQAPRRLLVDRDAGQAQRPVVQRQLERIAAQGARLRLEGVRVHHDRDAPGVALGAVPLPGQQRGREQRRRDQPPQHAPSAVRHERRPRRLRPPRPDAGPPARRSSRSPPARRGCARLRER